MNRLVFNMIVYLTILLLPLSCMGQISVFCRKVSVLPDMSGKIWDFSTAKDYYGFEKIKSYQITNDVEDKALGYTVDEWHYSAKGDTVYISSIDSIKLCEPYPFFIKDRPGIRSFITNGKAPRSGNKYHLNGDITWQPDIDGTLVFDRDFSVLAKMSKESINFELKRENSPISTSVELDSLRYYSKTKYSWTIEGLPLPVAIYIIKECRDSDGIVIHEENEAYCIKKEWLTGIWKTVPKDIDVIPVNNEGFEFYLPGGCEAVEADVRVTAQDGTDYGTAHFNLMPAESYFMKVPVMTQGVYYIYVTVNGETFKNKRTIR